MFTLLSCLGEEEDDDDDDNNNDNVDVQNE